VWRVAQVPNGRSHLVGGVEAGQHHPGRAQVEHPADPEAAGRLDTDHRRYSVSAGGRDDGADLLFTAGTVFEVEQQLVGVVLGTVLAVMRLSDNPLLRLVSGGYVWLFRGTPILVQLLFWFFLGTVLPQISIGIPFGPSFASVPTNTLITQFTAAILGLGLNEAAYMAEIVRAGIGSVDRGQTEAAHALGMSPRQRTVGSCCHRRPG
jgi:His/Glu/Gln/Arg/opine family amino acid ABC transporter permease subunit